MAPNDKAGSGKGASGDRDKSLEIALAQIERQFGRGAIMRLGDDTRAPVEVIPTGSISLDVALGVGGFTWMSRTRAGTRRWASGANCASTAN